MFVIFEKP